MEESKNKIVHAFEGRNSNFKKSLRREFRKKEPVIVNPDMYRYRDIILQRFVNELKESNDDLFDGVENPVYFVEQTLFEYINSEPI